MNITQESANLLYEAAKNLEDLMLNHQDDFKIEAKGIATDLLASSMIGKFIQAIKEIEESNSTGKVAESLNIPNPQVS